MIIENSSDGQQLFEDCPIQGDNNKRESINMDSLVSLCPGGNESPDDSPIIINLFYKKELDQNKIPTISQTSDNISHPIPTNHLPNQSLSSSESTSDVPHPPPPATPHLIVPASTLCEVVNNKFLKCKVCKQNNRNLKHKNRIAFASDLHFECKQCNLNEHSTAMNILRSRQKYETIQRNNIEKTTTIRQSSSSYDTPKKNSCKNTSKQ